MKMFKLLNFPPDSLKLQWVSLIKVSESVFGLKQSTKDWNHIGGISFFGCLGVIVLDLDAEGDKFVANSGPETAEKT